MSQFFYRRLNFYDKTGSPLNFNYIGATGPSELDQKFTYITSSSVSSGGQVSVSQLDINPGYIDLNISDVNGYNIVAWGDLINSYILNGADVYIKGRIANQGEFEAKISSVVNNSTYLTVNFDLDSINGQRLISLNNQIYFSTTYSNGPGGYFKGNIYFDPVSSGLYENQQIFIVQTLNNGGTLESGIPHTGATGATAGKWRSRWYNDNYGETDVSEIIFTYKIEDQLSGGDGYPLIVSYPNLVYNVDSDPTDSLSGNGYVSTSSVNSEALSVNVAINATDLASNIYERKLIIEDISTGTPVKIIEIDFYGEIVGEDERFNVMLQNMGRAFYQDDSIILRDHDPAEPLPNYIEINDKRKELLIAGEEIFPYIGSYKGLINAIRFFGYQDLRIKEYWLNLQYRSARLESPLQQNQTFLNQIKGQQSEGYTQSYQIGDVLDNPNSGKYKLVQTYGPNADGQYVLDVSSDNTILPSRTYKKTSLFGLYYDINKTTGNDSDYGYPEVVDAFQFTQEEILIKMFALKERLKRDYLPLNARIIDITGEGIYFNVYNTKAWTDVMQRPDIESGFYTEIRANPDFGFIEDLRNFSIRPLSTSIQTPSTYYNYFDVHANVLGGTGSALYITGLTGQAGVSGPNPILNVNAGKTYEFSLSTPGFDFYITTDPALSQVDPVGLVNNGVTAGGPSLVWNVNPQQTSPVYYYSSNNKALLNGVINVAPSELSDLGNIIDPLSNQQYYTPTQNESLLNAISNFYDLKQNGELLELGDGKYDPPAYIDPTTGLTYKTPIGMPIILELILDRWTWDELNINWSSLLIPVFKVGSRVLYKPTNIYGSVTSVNYSTGIYDLLLDNSTTVTTDESSLFSSIQNYSLLNWKNVDFSNMVEIEWIINKPATQQGSPYNFQFRGPILDFYNLAHFVPYTGVYQVTCNVYDAFNAKIVVIKNGAITVSPKIIDIDSWTRYREVEDYTWRNVFKGWNDYNSIWEYPAEGESIEVLEKTIPSEILDFATYGNKSEEGQDAYVKVNTDPIGATGYITFTQSNIVITEITSYLIIPGQYSFATVTCSTPHNLSTGDEVTLLNTIPQLTGRWVITVPSGSSNSFTIPIIISSLWNNTILLTGPSRLSVDSSIFTSQYFTGAGSISVYVSGRLIGSSESGDSLYRTVNGITSSINSLRTYPDYFASCTDPGNDPVTLVISAPDELGADQNGVSLTYEVSGSISVVSSSTELSGGVSPTESYVYWSESSSDLPNANLKYWGTKKLNWDVFTDNAWDEGYAHTWFDYEFNNDWLGGYELHNITPGDFLKISTGNEFYPYPTGMIIQPGSPALTIGELSSQLNNSSDTNIQNFYYRPIPNESGNLPLDTPPINISISNSTVTDSASAPPPAQINGSGLLIASYTYYSIFA
jgi:hypothetical protein